MREIPFWQRLGTRLTLLILGVAAVLTLATGILLVRGFDTVVRDAMVAAAEGRAPDAELGDVVRATIINLIAIFLFTLVGAAVFTRTLLTEPITQLVRGTRELAAGRLGTTLPITSRSELGRLAEDFNAMSRAVAESREHLEARVQGRTEELQALLRISNATALTLDLEPLLEVLLERLHEAVSVGGAALIDVAPDGTLERLATRGTALAADAAEGVAREAIARDAEVTREGVWALPLHVRGAAIGALLLTPRNELPEPRRELVRAFANQASVALENAQLAARVQEQAADEERQNLARELHDSVSQALYAILLGTHAAQRHLPDAPAKAADALAYVENLAQAGIAEMRSLIFELRPESLEEEGLVGVLRRQVEALERRHALAADADVGEEPELPFAVKKALFRVAQEALHNIVKHARARQVDVALRREEGGWVLTVADDGVGFDLQAASASRAGHLGLVSMRERLEAVGGTLALHSAPGAGTRLVARVPGREAARRLDGAAAGSETASPDPSGTTGAEGGEA